MELNEMDIENIAQCFHEAYERLAPEHGMAPFGVAEWGAPGMAKRRAFIRAVVTKALAASGAGTWLPADYTILPPVSTLSSGAIAAQAGIPLLPGATLSLDLTTQSYNRIVPGPMPDGASRWPPLPSVGETHVKAMITEAIAAAEDRIVDRVFAMLTDLLRISGHVRDER